MPKHPKKGGSTRRIASGADEILLNLQKSICRLVLLYVTLPHILKDTTAEQSPPLHVTMKPFYPFRI